MNKSLFWPQKISFGNNIMLRFPEIKGGPGNPCAPIDVNAFRTTNFRSSLAMCGAKFHGNTRRDGPTRILSIQKEESK